MIKNFVIDELQNYWGYMSKKSIIKECELSNIKKLANEGKSQSFIAKLYNVSNSCIQRFAAKYHIKFQHRKNINIKKCNETFFDIIDNEEKAYILGFLIADGCLRIEKRTNNLSYRICFNNSIDDIDVIQKIHDILCPYNKLVIRENKSNGIKRKPQVMLQFTSKKIFTTLCDTYSIKTRKTFDNSFMLPIDLIPNNLQRHFVRGYFDGDGSFTIKKDIRFVFNSPYFMQQISSIFENEFTKRDTSFTCKSEIVHGKTTDYWRLRINIGKKRLRCLYDMFYNDAKMFLQRKKEKIEYDYEKI